MLASFFFCILTHPADPAALFLVWLAPPSSTSMDSTLALLASSLTLEALALSLSGMRSAPKGPGVGDLEAEGPGEEIGFPLLNGEKKISARISGMRIQGNFQKGFGIIFLEHAISPLIKNGRKFLIKR